MAIAQTMAVTRVYGKTAGEIETMVEGFAWVLGHRTIAEASPAFKAYLKKNNQMPTPSDIEEIIDPPREELSASVYVAIKKRAAQGEHIWGDDREYIHAFEAQEMAKMRDGSEALRRASAELVACGEEL